MTWWTTHLLDSQMSVTKKADISILEISLSLYSSAGGKQKRNQRESLPVPRQSWLDTLAMHIIFLPLEIHI